MESIEPIELRSVLKKVEERGAIETADRGLMLVRQIWGYWLPTAGNDQRDITEGLKSRLLPYRGKNFPAIVSRSVLVNCFGLCMPTRVARLSVQRCC